MGACLVAWGSPTAAHARVNAARQRRRRPVARPDKNTFASADGSQAEEELRGLHLWQVGQQVFVGPIRAGSDRGLDGEDGEYGWVHFHGGWNILGVVWCLGMQGRKVVRARDGRTERAAVENGMPSKGSSFPTSPGPCRNIVGYVIRPRPGSTPAPAADSR